MLQGLILSILSFALPSLALSTVQALYTEQGVTSLTRRGSQIFAGTKRGDILILKECAQSGPILTKTSQVNNVDEKTFPVYSLASSPELLFCGCGDRFITVLSEGTASGPHHNDNHCIITQRLGPHTGWVKALYHDSTSNQLFSIGCNCIETWGHVDSSELQQGSKTCTSWKHIQKRAIDSSPSQGSTLSSDLLCLCGDALDSSIFYAGGVDGRIHTWSTDSTVLHPLSSMSAHAGRVTGLACDATAAPDGSATAVLFSWGHDGRIKCHASAGSATPALLLDLDLGDNLRATAGSLVRSSSSARELVVGCSNGTIKHFHVRCAEDDTATLEASTTLHGETCIAEGKGPIQAILLLPPAADGMLATTALVGHSKGLELVHL